MIDRMTWLKKHDAQLEAAALERDVNEAHAHIRRLNPFDRLAERCSTFVSDSVGQASVCYPVWSSTLASPACALMA